MWLLAFGSEESQIPGEERRDEANPALREQVEADELSCLSVVRSPLDLCIRRAWARLGDLNRLE